MNPEPDDLEREDGSDIPDDFVDEVWEYYLDREEGNEYCDEEGE